MYREADGVYLHQRPDLQGGFPVAGQALTNPAP